MTLLLISAALSHASYFEGIGFQIPSGGLLRDHVVKAEAAIAQLSRIDDKFQKGRRLYFEHCIDCHGASSRTSNLPYGMAGRDIRDRNVDINPNTLEEVISNGKVGTAMAPWQKRLTVGEIDAIAYFIRSARSSTVKKPPY